MSFKGSASVRARSLSDDKPSFEFDITYAKNGKFTGPGCGVSRYLVAALSVPKQLPYKNQRAKDADLARAQALADADLRRRLPLGGSQTLTVKAGSLRRTLNDFAPAVLTADRPNPKHPLEYVPVGPGTAAGDMMTWRTYCADRVGAWTFADFKNPDAGLAKLEAMRDGLRLPYTEAERAADIARGRDEWRLRDVGERLSRNTAAKICSCVATVLREAARDKHGRLVSRTMVEAFKYAGTRSTHAKKVDLSGATLNAFVTCWTFIANYKGELPAYAHLTAFGLLWYLGARPGELLGLFWSDFNNLDGQGDLSVTISRALENADKGKPRTLGGVKNDKEKLTAGRTVPLPNWLRPILWSWREYQRTRRENLGVRGNWHVLTNDTGTMNLTGRSCALGPWWQLMRARIIKARPDDCPVAAALRPAPGLYAFRHTAACALLREHKDPAYVAGLLGHSVKTLLDAYVVVMNEIRKHPDAYVGAAMPANLPMPVAGGGLSGEGQSDPASNVVPFSSVA